MPCPSWRRSRSGYPLQRSSLPTNLWRTWLRRPFPLSLSSSTSRRRSCRSARLRASGGDPTWSGARSFSTPSSGRWMTSATSLVRTWPRTIVLCLMRRRMAMAATATRRRREDRRVDPPPRTETPRLRDSAPGRQRRRSEPAFQLCGRDEGGWGWTTRRNWTGMIWKASIDLWPLQIYAGWLQKHWMKSDPVRGRWRCLRWPYKWSRCGR
mmetsp:Transcript_11875/g.34814  ORF Transcript_11875/g.34814 Transcript_11875/m.34814 type:complete len:210 (+) Transcript_11875:325-954(+)